uniref:Protein Rev n=1 Tax=Simian immunodeficiency virus TaxID=11723 RepID=G8Z0N3_SIV|nr:rev protein [Simian immunodeficiency virus]
MAGRSEERDELLLKAVTIIKVLYQSNPYPSSGGTRTARRKRRRRWRQRQNQIDQIGQRIFRTLLGGSQEPIPLQLPQIERLNINTEQDPTTSVQTSSDRLTNCEESS